MGVLYVVATPIGNMEDISIRAMKILLSSPTIVCEDTRRTGMMLKMIRERYLDKFNFQLADFQKLVSVRDWNEEKMVSRVLEEVQRADVALVSDAGTPLMSDPGFKVVRAAKMAGYKVLAIPGPFAGAAALSAAGLPTNIFKFWGFLPKKWELEEKVTHIIYESPLRAEKTIKKILEKYNQASIVVAQELTKIHESVEKWNEGMSFRGEVTILVYRGEEVAAGHGNGDGDVHN